MTSPLPQAPGPQITVPSRRTILRTSAWSVPAIAVAAASPAIANSGTQPFTFTTHQPHLWATHEFYYVGMLRAPGRTTTLEDVTLTFIFSGDITGTDTYEGITGLRGIGSHLTGDTTTLSRSDGPAGRVTTVTTMFPTAADPKYGHVYSFHFTCDRQRNVPLLGTLTTQASAHDGQSPVVTYEITK